MGLNHKFSGLRRKRLVPVGYITNPAKGSVDGACTTATNIVFRRPGVASARRGTSYAATADSRHERLFPYDGGLVGFFNDNTLRRKSGTTWVNYTGTYTNVEGLPARLRAVTAGGNLLVMTGTNLYRIAGITAAIEKAGAPRGLCFDRLAPAAVLVTAGGFLADQFQVAYRVVIAKKDLKGNVHFGEPSSRTIVANATFTSGWVTTEAKNVVLRAILSPDCTTDHYFQIYRSKQVAVGTQPDDDLQLVYQDYLTTLNISNKYVEITDTFPETVPKGAFIHTSPNYGNGFGKIDGENGPPPVFADACVFRDRLLGFRPIGYATFQLTILGVGGTAGIQNSDILHIADLASPSGTFFLVTATTGAPGANQYKIVTTGSTSQNLEQTALNLVEAINKHASNTLCYATYISGPSDIPGKILLTSRSPATASSNRFMVAVGSTSTRTCFDPVLSPGSSPNVVADYSFSLSRAATTVTATGANNLRVGEQVVITTSGSFVSGTYTVLTASAAAITYTQGSGAAGPTAGTGQLTGVSEAVYKSVLDVATNGWRFSKVRELDAFPLRNVGPSIGDSAVDIGRVFALRDSVIVWTFNGLYRISGDSPDTFTVTIVDPTLKIVGREAAWQVGESCYAWTSRGLVEANESGYRILSGDIDTELAAAFYAKMTDAKNYAVMVGNDQEQTLELYLPAGGGNAWCDSGYTYSLISQRFAPRTVPWLITCATYDPVTALINYGVTGGHYLFTQRLTYTAADLLDAIDSVTTQAIPFSLVLAPFYGNDRATWKNWQELLWLFETVAPSTAYTATLTNELTSEAITVTPTDTSVPVLRAWPSPLVVGNRLSVGLAGNLVQNVDFQLVGVEVLWEEFSTQVVR